MTVACGPSFVPQQLGRLLYAYSPHFILSKSPLAPSRQKKCIEALQKSTHDKLWTLVVALWSANKTPELSRALHENGLSMNNYNEWRHILAENDITKAVSLIEQRGYKVKPADVNTEDCNQNIARLPDLPSWVVLYLVGYKVRTPAHASGPLMDLVYSHLDGAPVQVQGPLLILTTVHLARFNLLLPLRRIVESFLSIPLLQPSVEFNLFLRAMSCIPYRSVENANNIVSIVRAMDARQLKLQPETYDALLNDRFLTLQLTKFLRERMVREGYTPKAAQLEAYLRFFAKDGAIHNAKDYFDAIHYRTTEECPSPEPVHPSQNPQYRANTLFLGAHEDRASAFKFLRDLRVEGSSEAKPSSRPATERRVSHLVHKRNADIYDFTAALSVAAKDLTTNSKQLVIIFQRMMLTVRPTVATYTIMIRGLLLRKDPHNAVRHWNLLLKTGLTIDKMALTAGLQAVTKIGHPHAAFALLEKYAKRPRDGDEVIDEFRSPHPVQLTPVSMNDFLVALNRIARPDVVFKMWDHMPDLYGIYPNSETLSIVLQSARLACKLDDSFSGTVAELALRNPFRKRKPQGVLSREDAVLSVESVLGQKNLKKYQSSIWNDQTPFDAARKVFLQALFGMDTSGRLLEIQPPANAVRDSFDADASPGIGFPSLRTRTYQFVPPPDLYLLSPTTQEKKPHFPQIVVTNANCFNYITLLGLSNASSSHVGEIPLVLAWMRALSIQPSNSTLAVALMLWYEVSVQAPLVEKLSGGPERGEYARLVEWVRGWVGDYRVPDAQLLAKWGGIIRKMRTSGEGR